VTISFDTIAARLRSKQYLTTDQLANDLASALSSLANVPSLDRGLSRDLVTDVQGGTTLGVGDPFAGLDSAPLVQRSAGKPDVVGGLNTRQQSRVETQIRRIPGTVVDPASPGQSEIQVKLVGENTGIANDPATGMQTVGDLMAGLSTTPVGGDLITVGVTGQPFVASGASGVQPVTAGQSVDVTVTQQWQTDTTYTLRNRKWQPDVQRSLKSESYAIVNDFQYGSRHMPPPVCTPGIIATSPFLGLFWDLTSHLGDHVSTPNSYWRIVQLHDDPEPFPTFGFPWWAAGTVDANGKLIDLPHIFYKFRPDLSYYLLRGCGEEGGLIGWPNLNSPGFNTSPTYTQPTCLSYLVTTIGVPYTVGGSHIDLTAYQNNWRGYPGSKWRIIVTGYMTNPVADAAPWWGDGTVAGDGSLMGLPSMLFVPQSDIFLGNLLVIIETGCVVGPTLYWTKRLSSTPPYSRTSPPF
jgi:hypothetical protein